MKRIISLLCVFLLILSAASCGEPQGTEDSSSNTENPVTASINPTFSAMPKKTQPLAEVYFLTEKVALFEFISPGMDSASVEVVCYDLGTDTLLGELNLGESLADVFPLDSGFAVIDYNNKRYTTYNTACVEQSATTLAFEGSVGSANLNQNKLLLSDLGTGRFYIYDLITNTATPADETLGAAEFTWAGNHKDSFLLYNYTSGLFAVTTDGKKEFITATAQSVQIAGETYIGGVVGDYAVFRSLIGAEAEMTLVRGENENFLSAFENALLSSSNGDTGALHYYDLDRRTVADKTVNGYIVDAALWDTASVAVINIEGEGLGYLYLDFANISSEGLDAATYDKMVIDNLRPLPEVSGVAAEVFETYGITIIDEHDFFDMAPYGYTITAASATEVADRTELIKDFLDYFPKGIFKELGTKAPVVIVLCEELGGNAGGLNTLIDGYNVSFLSVTGNGDYFCGIAAHELAHTIERGVSLTDLDAWAALQPTEVQQAYSNLSLTVEYTADDKGKTPVWFTDAYGRTNAMEDRATVFEEMYTAWATGDSSSLNYDGLKKKVAFWSSMLRNNFSCCSDADFTWDNLFE